MKESIIRLIAYIFFAIYVSLLPLSWILALFGAFDKNVKGMLIWFSSQPFEFLAIDSIPVFFVFVLNGVFWTGVLYLILKAISLIFR